MRNFSVDPTASGYETMWILIYKLHLLKLSIKFSLYSAAILSISLIISQEMHHMLFLLSLTTSYSELEIVGVFKEAHKRPE